MRKSIIGSLLFAALLAGVPAGATTCLCVGSGNSKFRGNGGVGGSFLRVDSPIPSQLRYYLLTTALQAQLSAVGKAYDSTSGWFCWNGTLK